MDDSITPTLAAMNHSVNAITSSLHYGMSYVSALLADLAPIGWITGPAEPQ